MWSLPRGPKSVKRAMPSRRPELSDPCAQAAWRWIAACAEMMMAGALALVVCMALGGCKSPPPGDPASTAPAVTPSFEELAAAHNARAADLQRAYAQGVIEIRWRDEKGSHFEQGNVEIWLLQPRRTALRVEKVGEVFLWLGSDEQQYWLFDLLGDETVLRLGRHGQPGGLGDGAMSIRPLAMLDLMGITPIVPDDAKGENPVIFDSPSRSWRIECTGSGGPMRLYLDQGSLLPVRVETLTSAGEVAAFSTLGRYESVQQQGVSPLAFPKMAHLIDVATPGRPGETSTGGIADGQIKIALNQAIGAIEQDQLDRVFNLEILMKGLEPDRIEHVGSVQADASASD